MKKSFTQLFCDKAESRGLHKRAGFALLELLIVLVIIAILAALALPQYKSMVRKAQSAEAKRALGALKDSLWRYFIQNGVFPDELNDRVMPDCLDIRVPESRYFVYTYAANGAPQIRPHNIVVVATYKDADTGEEQIALPKGFVIDYALWIFTTSPPEPLPPPPPSGGYVFLSDSAYVAFNTTRTTDNMPETVGGWGY